MAYKAGDITLYPTGSSEVILSSWGRKLKYGFEEGGSSDKTLDGSLKTDITYRKYIFELLFDLIDETSIAAIFTLYNLNVGLNLKIYTSPSTWFLNFSSAIPVVKIMPFRQDSEFLRGSTRYWKNVNIKLVEK